MKWANHLALLAISFSIAVGTCVNKLWPVMSIVRVSLVMFVSSLFYFISLKVAPATNGYSYNDASDKPHWLW